MIDNFRERKERRKKWYFEQEYKRKLVPCTSCGGSGYYDSTGSPPCGSCDGIGKMKGDPQ